MHLLQKFEYTFKDILPISTITEYIQIPNNQRIENM